MLIPKLPTLAGRQSDFSEWIPQRDWAIVLRPRVADTVHSGRVSAKASWLDEECMRCIVGIHLRRLVGKHSDYMRVLAEGVLTIRIARAEAVRMPLWVCERPFPQPLVVLDGTHCSVDIAIPVAVDLDVGLALETLQKRGAL